METPEQVAPTYKKLKKAFPLICDAKGELVDLCGLRHPGAGPEGIDVSRSASFLLDSEGRILWIHATDNFRVRPHPSEVLAAIDKFLGAPPESH